MGDVFTKMEITRSGNDAYYVSMSTKDQKEYAQQFIFVDIDQHGSVQTESKYRYLTNF